MLEKRKLPVDRNGKLTIHNLDPIFRDIRDLHLSTAFSVLKRTGQDLKTKQLERERMNISEMKEFVQQKLSIIQNQQKSLEIRKFNFRSLRQAVSSDAVCFDRGLLVRKEEAEILF